MADGTVQSTDADYNASTRTITIKIDLYINGNDQDPVAITRSNYLISASLLEETNSDDNIFGSVTANEIDFTLMNTDRIFTPTNAESIYYGKMVKGIKAVIYCKAGDEDSDLMWDELGTFYVTKWVAAVTGLTTNVTATDSIYNVLAEPMFKGEVKVAITQANFFKYIFNNLGYTITTPTSLSKVLSRAYITEDTQSTLNDLCIGTFANCFCDHAGDIKVLAYFDATSLRATITDDDQIISVDSSQGLDNGYDGAEVQYYVPTVSAPIEVLTISNLSLAPGTTVLPYALFNSYPLYALSYAAIETDTYKVVIGGIAVDQLGGTVTLVNNDASTHVVTVRVYGRPIDPTSSIVATEGSDLLTVDSHFIQDPGDAVLKLATLQNFVDNTTPVLKLTTRGNALFNLGDKIHVVSEMYKLDYTGIIIRQEFTYAGSLQSSLTLLNASMFGGA